MQYKAHVSLSGNPVTAQQWSESIKSTIRCVMCSTGVTGNLESMVILYSKNSQ